MKIGAPCTPHPIDVYEQKSSNFEINFVSLYQINTQHHITWPGQKIIKPGGIILVQFYTRRDLAVIRDQ